MQDEDIFAAIQTLRKRGWGVLTFTPGELGAVDRQRFEERLGDMAYDLIDAMQPDVPWED